jgi:hypothetical protein
MAVTEQFYRERADEARSAAAASELANVVERNLRAAAAWQAMADRVHRGEVARVELAARKAALLAAETATAADPISELE